MKIERYKPRMLKVLLLIPILCSLSYLLGAQEITVGDNGDYATLSAAAPNLLPGDVVILQSQTFDDGAQYLYGLNGTSSQPIIIRAEQQHQAIFQGGSTAIQLAKCNYVEIDGIQVFGQTANGMNIDDGGDYDDPSTNITIRNCIFRDIQATGNNDLLKMSGVDNFVIEHCQFLNGSISQGSGLDFVGCHNGVVQDCVFDNLGNSGIQAKGGAQFIRIQRNLFKNIDERALNLGGSTGLQFFRPPLSDPIVDAFEAADLDVFSNVFINCYAPIAYVGSVRVKVYNNTIYQPGNWVMRILQETTTAGFLTCGDNEFSNNIIYLANDLTEVNVGGNTAPNSFTLTNNLWYNASSSNWSPDLPVLDSNQIIADPLFSNASGEEFSLLQNSPAIASGQSFIGPDTDFNGNSFNVPPSIGAFEGQSVLMANPHIELDLNCIDILSNPVTDSFTINGLLGDYSLEIVDLNGNVHTTVSNLGNSRTIDMSDLPSGIWLIKIVQLSNNALCVEQIIKY